MTKDSKILLVVIVVCTLALAGLQFQLHSQALKLNTVATQALYKAVVAPPAPAATPETTASAVPKAKSASPSATAKKTVAPTVAPEPEVEATPSE